MQQITNEAADWLLRLEETPEERCHSEFVSWLKISPRHVDEFLMVEAAYRTVHQFDPKRRMDLTALVERARAEIVPLKPAGAADGAGASTAPPRGRARIVAYAAAAVLALGLAALAPHWLQMNTYTTGIGEQRSFQLSDGSLLHLNTQSRARIRFSADSREVRLQRGEALVFVKPDASRPFRIDAGVAGVEAVGTAFNVYRRTDNHTRVSVLEGRVKILAEDLTPTYLAAGEEANVLPGGEILTISDPDVARTLAWRQRRLVFGATPLAEVVEQFNRYNRKPQLWIQGDAIGQRRITGTFNADEPQALLRFLRDDPDIRMDTGINEVRIRPQPQAP